MAHDGVEAANDSPPAVDEKEPKLSDIKAAGSSHGSDIEEPLRGPNGEEYPTKEELDTLRRVKGPINWIIYTIAFVELCERFAYYGTTAVCTSRITEVLPCSV